MDILAIIGAITGIGALVSVGVLWGRMSAKVDTLWQIFLESAKERNPHFWNELSPKALSPEARVLLLETGLVSELDSMRGHSPQRVIIKLGHGRLSTIANGREIGVEELVAAIAVYIEEANRGCAPNKGIIKRLFR